MKLRVAIVCTVLAVLGPRLAHALRTLSLGRMPSWTAALPSLRRPPLAPAELAKESTSGAPLLADVLRAEAGVSIEQLNHRLLPRGWFVPVTPGTQFVTLGGMVASGERPREALARESWEEAGLFLTELAPLRPGPTLWSRRPLPDGGALVSTAAGGGLMCLVIVKPLLKSIVSQESRRTTTGNLESYGACTELASVIHQAGAPRVIDGAVLGLLASGYAGSLASSILAGALEVIWE